MAVCNDLKSKHPWDNKKTRSVVIASISLLAEQNCFSLLLMASMSLQLVEPSIADSNCKSRCEEQNISYFRLNPRLEQVVGAGETDMEVLISMIIQTSKEMNERREMADLVLCFHSLSEAARKMHAHISGEESETDASTLEGSKSMSNSGSQLD